MLGALPTEAAPGAPPRGRGRLVLLLSALWTLPLWVVAFPPMVDYPQQLALSAILRWYGDAGRLFHETYEIAWTTPHSLFKLLTAGLAWVLPIQAAGRLVVALSLAAVGAAGLALCRQTGRPAWYALAALALTYNYCFFWGFVDNLIAYPLVLAGLALAERRFERPWTVASWLQLAGLALLFYTVHLQFLLVFAGCVGWLALTRLPEWKRLALWLSALVPGLLLGAWVLNFASLHAPAGVISDYERRMRTAPTVIKGVGEKLIEVPRLLFGHSDGNEWILALLLLGFGLIAVVGGIGREQGGSAPADGPGWRGALFRTRFATLTAWLAFLYFVSPEFRGGFLIAERLAPLAAMVGVVALPPPAAARRRLAAILVAGLVVFQLGQTLSGFLRFGQETAGLGDLLAGTAPGENLAGLIFEPRSEVWERYPVYLHFPAYYQVEKGGRILFSFAELYQTTARFRPGKSWEDLLVEWNEWNPHRFSYPRHGQRFRYFLVRGGPEQVGAAFGPALREMKIRSVGRWYLLEKDPRQGAGQSP